MVRGLLGVRATLVCRGSAAVPAWTHNVRYDVCVNAIVGQIRKCILFFRVAYILSLLRRRDEIQWVIRFVI